MNPIKAIVAATIALLTLLPIAGAQGSYQHNDPPPAPSVGHLVPGTLKWILPPRTSVFYNDDKAFALRAGYEVVEHDDFSYPPPRNP